MAFNFLSPPELKSISFLDSTKFNYKLRKRPGTHQTNTRKATTFALLSEEGIAKGVRRITAVTIDCAFEAIELVQSLEMEVAEASKVEGSLLEKHIHPEGNFVADRFSHHVYTFDPGVHYLSVPPDCIASWLFHDLDGVTYFR